MSVAERTFQEAYRRMNADQNNALGLGLVLLIGMVAVEELERFAGAGLENTYHTHFPMPNGEQWSISVSRKPT